MSNLTTTDPRRPKKLRRFVPSSPDGASADQTIDYLNFVGMILSMCGLLFEVKLAAWVAVACAFVTYANSRSGEDTKQLISGFMPNYPRCSYPQGPIILLTNASYMSVSFRILFVHHLYSGGLAEQVDLPLLRAAFIPFGDIISINMPMDYQTEKHRGFAFIEFEEVEDAMSAIDNMVGSAFPGFCL
ncbi:hypothetical protein AHF37_04524 [Paragonimus kellicotti]|nr:hypothetical protein AHF37_04524 [Paragonimus kellicotti]